MGTSQSHNLKSSPNWSSAKHSITNIAKKAGNADSQCKSFIRSLRAAIGDAIYRSDEGHRRGRVSTFGGAGGRLARNFVSLIKDIRQESLHAALNITELPIEQQPTTKEDFIDRILQQVSGEHDSSMDDDAAIYAMNKLLDGILCDCKTLAEVENKFKTATNDQLACWIIDYEIEYILEYSAELFQSHILDKCNNPENVIGQIRNWLHNELDNRLQDNLSQHDLLSAEGKQLLDTLTADILEIWKQE